MPKVRELAIVKAHLYRPGEVSMRKTLHQLENELWWFADPEASTIWDAVEDEQATSTRFSCAALWLSIEPAPTPTPRLNGHSYLDALLFERDPDEAFERDRDAIAHVAKRRLLDADTNKSRFYGLFEVEFSDVPDHQLDPREIRASFLGELDFNQSLSSLSFTVTTAELEARVLAAMRAYRVPMSVGLIADAVNVRHDLIGDPILALDHAGLIASDYSGQRLVYSLTDRAMKGIL